MRDVLNYFIHFLLQNPSYLSVVIGIAVTGIIFWEAYPFIWFSLISGGITVNFIFWVLSGFVKFPETYQFYETKIALSILMAVVYFYKIYVEPDKKDKEQNRVNNSEQIYNQQQVYRPSYAPTAVYKQRRKEGIGFDYPDTKKR
jgi:hypothetical protein